MIDNWENLVSITTGFLIIYAIAHYNGWRKKIRIWVVILGVFTLCFKIFIEPGENQKKSVALISSLDKILLETQNKMDKFREVKSSLNSKTDSINRKILRLKTELKSIRTIENEEKRVKKSKELNDIITKANAKLENIKLESIVRERILIDYIAQKQMELAEIEKSLAKLYKDDVKAPVKDYKRDLENVKVSINNNWAALKDDFKIHNSDSEISKTLPNVVVVGRKNSSLKDFSGKILIDIPDTMKIFKEHKVTIRISKSNFDGSVFLVAEEEKRFQSEERIFRTTIIDSLAWNPLMVVELLAVESERVKIKALTSKIQPLDSTSFSQWLFSVKPVSSGTVGFLVTVSVPVKTDAGTINRPYTRIYEREIKIATTVADMLKLYWQQYLIIYIGLFILIAIALYKLLPNKTIIINMDNFNNTNFWSAGSVGVVIYLITIVSFVVFAALDISLLFVPLIFVGTILIYIVFTAVSLRDNNKLSEENFLSLMGIALMKIPPLNWGKKTIEVQQKQNESTATPKIETLGSKLYKWTDHKLISIIIYGIIVLIVALIGKWLGILDWFK